jgi:hypothetical protein
VRKSRWLGYIEDKLSTRLLYGQTLWPNLTNDDFNLFQRFSFAGSAAAIVKAREKYLSLTDDANMDYPEVVLPQHHFDVPNYF